MRTWVRAARAAALLLIASGAGGAASTFLPALDERWIFVGAVAIIGAMEGLVIGVISAVAAVACYELMLHSALSYAPQRDTLLLGAAAAAAIAARGARVTVSRPRLGASSQRVVLLPPPQTLEREHFDRIAELEEALDNSKFRAERGMLAHVERIAAVEREINELRAVNRKLESAGDARAGRIAELEIKNANLASSYDATEARAKELERESEALKARIAQLEGERGSTADTERARIAELEMEVRGLRDSAAARERESGEIERAHATAAELSRARIAELEEDATGYVVRVADLERASAADVTRIANLARELASRDARLSQLDRDLMTRDARVADLERDCATQFQYVADLESAAKAYAARIGDLQTRLAKLQEENSRIPGLEEALTTARSTSESLAGHIADLEQAIEHAEENDANRDAQIGDLHANMTQALIEKQELQRERDQALARLASIEAEWNAKLQTIVSHLASDHETDMGQALLEREEARAETRSLNLKLTELRRALDQQQPEHGFAIVRAGVTPNGRKILLVHRDAMLRTMARQALERSGYKVATAADGLEALRTAITAKPDVILADVQMPKLDGRALVQLLKSRPETAGVKVILIGAASGPADAQPDGFLEDASNIEALRQAIENVVA